MRLPYIKTAAFAVLITFISSSIVPQGWSAPVSETAAPVPFDLKIPGNLASIDSLISGRGPAVLHIQTAHGNYESQKKIQSLLHYLDEHYGFKTLFVEGSPFDLEPEALRFFPKQMPLTMKINDELARKSIVKGSELFLAEARDAKAYGIEDLDTYKANGEAFKAVLRAQPETEQFVRSLDLQIGRLSSVLINKDLRSALDRLEAFENGHIGLGERLAELSSLARKHLKLEFTNARSQTEWPMLVRYFKVTAWEKEIQAAPLAEEKKKFFEVIKSFPRKNEIQQLLDSQNVQNSSPEQLEGLAEQLAAWLPQSFDPSLYPNVNRALGIQLLQSEIQGRLLAEEMERLTGLTLKQLTQNEQEEKILRELKNYSTLHKLFRLELTPADYEHVLSEKENLIPSHIAARFQKLNTQDRVQNLVFEHLDALDSLYQKALEFYRFVKQRDEVMLRRLNEQMRDKKIQKAVVVTGGFHSAPFEDYFRKAGLNYALLSPRITQAPAEGERQAYIDAVFQNNTPAGKATYDTPTIALSRNRLAQLHSLPWLDRQIDSAYRAAGATRAENRDDSATEEAEPERELTPQERLEEAADSAFGLIAGSAAVLLERSNPEDQQTGQHLMELYELMHADAEQTIRLAEEGAKGGITLKSGHVVVHDRPEDLEPFVLAKLLARAGEYRFRLKNLGDAAPKKLEGFQQLYREATAAMDILLLKTAAPKKGGKLFTIESTMMEDQILTWLTDGNTDLKDMRRQIEKEVEVQRQDSLDTGAMQTSISRELAFLKTFLVKRFNKSRKLTAFTDSWEMFKGHLNAAIKNKDHEAFTRLAADLINSYATAIVQIQKEKAIQAGMMTPEAARQTVDLLASAIIDYFNAPLGRKGRDQGRKALLRAIREVKPYPDLLSFIRYDFVLDELAQKIEDAEISPAKMREYITRHTVKGSSAASDVASSSLTRLVGATETTAPAALLGFSGGPASTGKPILAIGFNPDAVSTAGESEKTPDGATSPIVEFHQLRYNPNAFKQIFKGVNGHPLIQQMAEGTLKTSRTLEAFFEGLSSAWTLPFDFVLKLTTLEAHPEAISEWFQTMAYLYDFSDDDGKRGRPVADAWQKFGNKIGTFSDKELTKIQDAFHSAPGAKSKLTHDQIRSLLFLSMVSFAYLKKIKDTKKRDEALGKLVKALQKLGSEKSALFALAGNYLQSYYEESAAHEDALKETGAPSAGVADEDEVTPPPPSAAETSQASPRRGLFSMMGNRPEPAKEGPEATLRLSPLNKPWQEEGFPQEPTVEALIQRVEKLGTSLLRAISNEQISDRDREELLFGVLVGTTDPAVAKERYKKLAQLLHADRNEGNPFLEQYDKFFKAVDLIDNFLRDDLDWNKQDEVLSVIKNLIQAAAEIQEARRKAEQAEAAKPQLDMMALLERILNGQETMVKHFSGLPEVLARLLEVLERLDKSNGMSAALARLTEVMERVEGVLREMGDLPPAPGGKGLDEDAYSRRNPSAKITIETLYHLKAQGIPITMLTAYDESDAALLEQGGVDLIFAGDSGGMVRLGKSSTQEVTMEMMESFARSVQRGIRNAHFVVDMPHESYLTPEQALANAKRFVAIGAESIKLEGGEEVAPVIKFLVDHGIPVMGHIAYTPQSKADHKVVGSDAEGAKQLLKDALAVEDAGAYAVVIELADREVSRWISKALKIPTIGIGAGAGTDGQVLVLDDLLGWTQAKWLERRPKYGVPAMVGREYWSWAEDTRDPKETLRVVRSFVEKTHSREFPGDQNSFHKYEGEPLDQVLQPILDEYRSRHEARDEEAYQRLRDAFDEALADVNRWADRYGSHFPLLKGKLLSFAQAVAALSARDREDSDRLDDAFVSLTPTDWEDRFTPVMHVIAPADTTQKKLKQKLETLRSAGLNLMAAARAEGREKRERPSVRKKQVQVPEKPRTFLSRTAAGLQIFWDYAHPLLFNWITFIGLTGFGWYLFYLREKEEVFGAKQQADDFKTQVLLGLFNLVMVIGGLAVSVLPVAVFKFMKTHSAMPGGARRSETARSIERLSPERIREIDERRLSEDEQGDDSRAENRDPEIEQAALLSGSGGDSFAVTTPENTVSVGFLVQFQNAQQLLSQSGRIKAFVRYALYNEKGELGPWSNASTDLPLEIKRIFPTENPNAGRFEGQIRVPAAQGKMKFNIRLERDGHETWFTNRTADNNGILEFQAIPQSWRISRIPTKADNGLLQFEQNLPYADEADRWTAEDFNALLQRSDILGEYLLDDRNYIAGFYLFRVTREGNTVYRNVLRFSVRPGVENKELAEKIMIHSIKQRPMSNLNVYAVHLREDESDLKALWESQGFTSERIENFYGFGRHAYRLVYAAEPASEMVKNLNRLSYAASIDFWDRRIFPAGRVRALGEEVKQIPENPVSAPIPSVELAEGDVNASAIALADLWRGMASGSEKEDLLERVFRYDPEIWGKYAEGIRPWLLWLLMDRDFKVRRKVIEINDWLRTTDQGGKLGVQFDPELLIRHFREPWISVEALGQPVLGDANEQTMMNKRLALLTTIIINALLPSQESKMPADIEAALRPQNAYQVRMAKILNDLFLEEMAPVLASGGDPESWMRPILQFAKSSGKFALGQMRKLNFWEGVYLALARFKTDFPDPINPFGDKAPNSYLFGEIFETYFQTAAVPPAAMLAHSFAETAIAAARAESRPVSDEVKNPDHSVQEFHVWKIGEYEITEFGAAVIKGPGLWQKENGTVVRQDSGLAVPGGIPLMLPANARTVGGNMITRDGSSINVLASPLARAVDSLVPGEKHQLHGFTDKVKWFVTAASDDSITFSLNSDEVMLNVEGAKTLADIIGKVSFTQTYKAENGTLTSRLEIKNLEKQNFIKRILFNILNFIANLFKSRTGFLRRLAGRFDKRVVLGGGYHPFYQVENIEDWTVQIPANHYWAADAVPLAPNAKPYGVLSSGLDFRHPQPLTYGLEAVLSEFIPDKEGQVSVILKNVKSGEVKKISFPYESFSSLLLWVPPQDKAPATGIFSIEPLLSIPNGRNLFLSGNKEAQPLVLGPGQTHTASWSVESRSEMRSATYHEEQKRVLKLMELNQALPADDAQKAVLLKAVDGLSMSALEKKLARKLPKAIDSAEPIKQVRKIKWDEVRTALKDLLDRGRIYISADAELSSIQLAGDFLVLSTKLFENTPSRFELLQMMLAKEAVVILEGKKPVQGKNQPPTVFEKQLKGWGAVAGLYYLLFPNEQDASRIALNGPTSNLSGNDIGTHPFGFIRILFRIFNERDRAGAVNQSAQTIGSEFLKRWSGASREELTAEALNILSVEPGDRMDPFDERFLSSTVSHPIQVKSEEGWVIWTRESPETGNKVEIKFASIQPQPGEERMIFSADFHRGPEYAKGQTVTDQYLRIFILEDSDYGTVYRIVTRGDDIKDLFGEPMPHHIFAFPGRVTAFLETLQARSRSVQNPDLNAAVQNWKSFLSRERYEVIDQGWDKGRDMAKTARFAPESRVELARQIARANEERLREVVRQQHIRDAEIARNEEAEFRRKRFQLGNIETVAIRFIGEEDPVIAQEIKRQFEAIGFKNVTTDEGMAPFAEIVLFVSKGDLPEGVLTEADILFRRDQGTGGFYSKIFVYDTEKKEMARMQSSLYTSSSWSLRNEVSGYRRYEQAYHIKTPALAAEFAAKEVVTDLENSRKNQAPEEVNAMVSLEYEHPPVVYDMDASHVSQMVQLLGAAETMIQITSDEERRQVQSSRLIFSGRPFYEFRDKKPYLIFDDLDYEGFLRLKEEEEVEINFDGISFSGRALVVESQDGRLVTTVPMGLDLTKQIPQVTGGSIMKRYNGVTAEVQQAFLRSVMEDVSRHPLVATALGIDYPRETDAQDRTSLIQLENAKIAQHPEQVEMIAHAINGQNIELGWGPPGTGKTTIAAEVLYQNYKEGISQIVAAQTNRAVDNLLLKAKEKGVKVYRLGNHPQVIDPALRENWIYADRPQKPREPKSFGSQEEREKYEQQFREWKDAYEKWKAGLIEEIFSGRAVVGGTITGIAIDSFLREVERDKNRSRYGAFNQDVRFRRGIVEEASVASFAELLLAFSKIEQKVLVIGDPKQLGVSPVTGEIENRLKASIEEGQLEVLQTSLFEFLLQQNRFPVTMLRDNFRSTPLQVKATNFWYDGKLRAMKNVPEDVNRNSLIVIDTHLLPDTEEQPGGTSWQNKAEAEILEDVLRSLKSEVSVHDVGMITPYQSQIREIKSRIKKLLRGASPNDIQVQMSNIGTVWPFQGRELPLIFVSAVRSNKPEEKRGGRVTSNTGFASGEMWNVETSRGEWANVLIFNSATFQASRQPQVPEFIDHVLRLAKEEGIYIELKPGENNETSFARAAHGIDRNMTYAAGQKRAEAREIPVKEEKLGASVGRQISEPLLRVTRLFRGGILPFTAMTVLIANGKLADALDRVLGKEKVPVFTAPAGGYLRSELKINGPVSFSRQFFEDNASHHGRIFAEKSWLEKVAENPRALFLFLKAAQEDKNKKSSVTVFLPQNEKEEFPGILARALESRTSASGAELEELNALKESLLSGRLIDFRELPDGQSEEEALERGAVSEKVQGAVVWHSGIPFVSADTANIHFSSGPAVSEDMPLIVLAALLSRKLGEQTSQLALKPELLKEQTRRFLQQVLPGFQMENGLISPFNLAGFALEAAASQYIATQA